MTVPVSASRKDAMAPGLTGRVVVAEITGTVFTSLVRGNARYTFDVLPLYPSLPPRRSLGLSRTHREARVDRCKYYAALDPDPHLRIDDRVTQEQHAYGVDRRLDRRGQPQIRQEGDDPDW